MAHYSKDDYKLSSPERSTTLQKERQVVVPPSQPPPRQGQLWSSRDRRAVDNASTGEETQKLLTAGITRASPFNDDWEWPANENRALVLRKGDPHQNVGEVLDRSIRVRGEDVTQNPTDKHYSATSYRVPGSGPGSYADRSLPYVSHQATMESELDNVDRYGQSESGYSSKAYFGRSGRKPLHREIERVKDREWRRRSPRHALSPTSSDDDDYQSFRDGSSSRSESKLSDQQLITKTLQKYTTFQSDKLPAAAINSEPTPLRDDPLRSRPKDDQGYDAMNGESQDASAGARSQSVPLKPSVVTTAGEVFNGAITGPDLNYVDTDPRRILSRNGIPSPPSIPYWRPIGAGFATGPSDQSGESQWHRRDDGESTLPPFNPPRQTSRGDVNHVYPPVAPILNGRHTDDYHGNSASGTSPPKSSDTGAHEAREAAQGVTPREPRVTAINDASSDTSKPRRLHRQDRKATIEDAEAEYE